MDGGLDNVTSSNHHDGRPNTTNHKQTLLESLLPVTIGLVCGIILVLSCFVASFIFLRRYERRVRSTNRKPRREPELLSYNSTADSYKAGIIWDFENKRNVKNFLRGMIDRSLVPARSALSSIRSSRKRKTNTTSATKSRDSSHKSSENSSDPLYSGSTLSTRESRLQEEASDMNMAVPYSIYDETLHDIASRNPSVLSYDLASDISPRSSRHHSSRVLSAENLYEEIPLSLTNIPRYYDRHWDHSTSRLDAHESPSVRLSRPTSSNVSARTLDTCDGRDKALERLPGALNVLSLSDLSINIRSCPDSPLCDQRTSRLDQLNSGRDVSVPRELPSLSGMTSAAFSTTILDIVQGEARKRGLVPDSLVHQSPYKPT